MSFLQAALDLAGLGFHVFPLVPNSKLPAIDSFPHFASSDYDQVTKWWIDPVLGFEQPFNVGISTSKFKTDQALVVVDVDNKGEKKGDEEILALEMQGSILPETFTQLTPTGGRHLVYVAKEAVKQGVAVLGTSIDIRSRGGYIVGAGSEVDGKFYTADLMSELAPAPDWLIKRCGKAPEPKSKKSKKAARPVDASTARDRAIHYLEKEAPLSVKGQGGDQTAYRVAARVKDFGVSETDCLGLMLSHWNERTTPGWSAERLREKVEHAYAYGQEEIGAAAPEADFDPIEEVAKPQDTPHPFQLLNKEYAFVLAGGGSHILWETTDSRGLPALEHLGTVAFHQKLAAHMMMIGDGKTRPVSELWMRSKERRSYDGICFRPGQPTPPRFYNLWKGFAVEPISQEEWLAGADDTHEKSLQMFLHHALHNVCRKDEKLFYWLMGYFAHLVQRPWEKPLTSIVFRGKKGVGKNALVDRVGFLLGNHYLLTSNRRYLIGNFNGHLENCLLFVLDEAFWSGDKQAEGTLKDLITGNRHVIEHKGKEPYSVENCTRVCIIGNEEWLVPATQDERRFAVFDVGDGRKQDRRFFQAMREGMEQGGYRLLLRYLLDFDLSKVDVNAAPSTSALLDQKVNSLEPFYQWVLDCLHEGKVVGSDFGEDWQEEVDKDRFRSAFRRYVRERQIRSRIPDDRTVGRLLLACFPSATGGRRRDGIEQIRTYKLPELLVARRDWDRYIGHPVEWDK